MRVNPTAWHALDPGTTHKARGPWLPWECRETLPSYRVVQSGHYLYVPPSSRFRGEGAVTLLSGGGTFEEPRGTICLVPPCRGMVDGPWVIHTGEAGALLLGVVDSGLYRRAECEVPFAWQMRLNAAVAKIGRDGCPLDKIRKDFAFSALPSLF